MLKNPQFKFSLCSHLYREKIRIIFRDQRLYKDGYTSFVLLFSKFLGKEVISVLALLLAILKHFLKEEHAHFSLLFRLVAWYSCFVITKFLFLVTIGLFLSLWTKLYYNRCVRLPKHEHRGGHLAAPCCVGSVLITGFMMYTKVEMPMNLVFSLQS